MIAAPLTYGAGWFNPLGIKTFIIGFCKFFLTLSAHPSHIAPRIKYPVLFWLVSFEFIKAQAASNKIGYIFFALIEIANVSISQSAIYWTNYPGYYYWLGR